MSLYAQAVAAERAAKIERDMVAFAEGIDAIKKDRDILAEQVNVLRYALVRVSQLGALWGGEAARFVKMADAALAETERLSSPSAARSRPASG